MGINLLANENPKGINLLADEVNTESFEELSPEDQEKALGLAKQKISGENPNLPDWLRDLILKATPKDNPEMLGSAARGFSNVTDYIPAIAGGALQGVSIPIRGVASFVPGENASKLANSPDLRDIFLKAQGTGQKSAQLASELLGGGGVFGKLMQGVKGASALAKVPKALQTPASLAGAGVIATPGGVTEKAEGAGTALALGGLGHTLGKVAGKVSEKLPEFFRGLTSKSTPKALVQSIQKPHDILQSTADDIYGQARQAVKKRNISIPIKESHLVEVADILPKTRATAKLIEKAKSGDYEAVQQLQSHLYKKGTKALSSDDIALENQGEEILELRDKINDDAENHLIKEGHLDVAHLLKQGKKVYAQLKDTYFNKLIPKGIGKLVHSETRLIPEKPVNLFTQNSEPMKIFLQKHPEASKHVQRIKEKEKAIKALNKTLLGSGVTGGLLAGGKTLYDLFK